MTVEAAPMSPGKGSGSSSLPYPDRFHAAVQFISKPPAGSKSISDETRLLLYALHQQATVGPCKETKPWGWNVVETAKWQTWSQLGSMSGVEAMRLYVRELEEEQPDWFTIMGGYTPPPATPPVANDQLQDDSAGLDAVDRLDEWAVLDIAGSKRPPPRYEHAAAIVEGKLYIVGGNCGGRYLGDVWSLSLDDLEWLPTPFSGGKQEPGPPPSSGPDNPPPPQPSLPPCAGHAVVSWGSRLLSVGGLTKTKDKSEVLPVRVLDTHAMAWSLMSPGGKASPPQLGGHTVTLIGSNLYVFGGEDVSRKLSNNLYILDLESMSWSAPATSGDKPTPRSAHVATSYAGRYLLVFGGGSVAHCYQDLHVLDTESMEWFVPTVEGNPPSSRAGHAAAALGSMWYIIGGGNNTSGCLDMMALDMSELGTGALKWIHVAKSLDKRSALVSEGLSLQAVPSQGALIAFGGYNGKYHNDVHVFKPSYAANINSAPVLAAKIHVSSPRPKASGDASLDSAETAPLLVKQETKQTLPPQSNGNSKAEVEARMEAVRKEAEDIAREATAARESAAHELALMRRQLVSAQNALADAEKSLEESRSALTTEQNKNFKLEVEMAELKQKLSQMEEMEKELEHYRRQAQEAQAKKGSGLWGYIAG